jgi:hypothetical protein
VLHTFPASLGQCVRKVDKLGKALVGKKVERWTRWKQGRKAGKVFPACPPVVPPTGVNRRWIRWRALPPLLSASYPVVPAVQLVHLIHRRWTGGELD